MIDGVAENLEQMKPEQYVLAFVFIGSYAFALGEFIGTRGRWIAAGTAFSAAVAFVWRTEPWELGVMMVAFALVGMGLFAGAAWLLWRVGGREVVDTPESVLVEDMPARVEAVRVEAVAHVEPIAAHAMP